MTAKEKYLQSINGLKSKALKNAEARLSLQQWNDYSNALVRPYRKDKK